ncbi:hypothetical protein MJ904_06725 [Massilia sp. MB5]|uniref:hypothetical protein n=1 Tax=unclassified Massilia TaxID=2609279 RepID=UPI00067BE939|nr:MULTISPECIES: hypothetical protein [unclassified Massilia]AKU23208.1 hypothetical protein ACZ75_18830 [Massilia sp. NR 4-1]UMR31883.1 hypothetical protein MJ904_06725 [Massilia sp. MB5]
MYPWLWFWNPQLNLPLSGHVAQQFDLRQLLRTLPSHAGDGAVEGDVVHEVASYGKQIGWLTDVLLDEVKEISTKTAEKGSPLAELRTTRDRIEEIKKRYRPTADSIFKDVQDLQHRDGKQFQQLRKQLLDILQQPAAG